MENKTQTPQPTQAEIDAKYDYWMRMYQLSLDYSDKLAKATANKDAALKKAKSNAQLAAQAKELEAAFEQYKAVYIPFGRTLAEIINQPAKLFSKLVWLHNMAESSEGPPNNTSVAQLEAIEKLMKQADQQEGKAFRDALASFNRNSM